MDSQVLSWTDSQITVEVPSLAGTGNIRITDNAADTGFSSSNLTVSYALLNGENSGNDYPFQHYGDNGNGGMTLTRVSVFMLPGGEKMMFDGLFVFDRVGS